ncbi:MAG: TetR/AcrR family transcriptional regulator [Bacteroidota bacterium]
MPKARLFDQKEVLEKAMLLFWERGYYHTSVQDLVDHLGISRSSLYDTYGGKKQLYYSAFELYCRSNRAGLVEFLRTQDDVRSGLRMAFKHLVSDDFEDPACKGCFIVNTSTELLPLDDKLKQEVAAHKEAMESILHDFLQKGVEAGQISRDKDLLTLARVIYVTMTGLRVLGKTRPEPEDTMAAVDAVMMLLDD